MMIYNKNDDFWPDCVALITLFIYILRVEFFLRLLSSLVFEQLIRDERKLCQNIQQAIERKRLIE